MYDKIKPSLYFGGIVFCSILILYSSALGQKIDPTKKIVDPNDINQAKISLETYLDQYVELQKELTDLTRIALTEKNMEIRASAWFVVISVGLNYAFDPEIIAKEIKNAFHSAFEIEN